MNDNAKLWVEALESGKYKQGKEELGSEENGYCCLGVACRVYEDVTGDDSLSEGTYKRYNHISLRGDYTKVKKWLGLKTSEGVFDEGGKSNYLTSLNDKEGYTFKQIAEVIKSEPEGLFIKENK